MSSFRQPLLVVRQPSFAGIFITDVYSRNYEYSFY
jgi:hypothetical protein